LPRSLGIGATLYEFFALPQHQGAILEALGARGDTPRPFHQLASQTATRRVAEVLEGPSPRLFPGASGLRFP
jgi:hypothetical protein